MEMKDRSNYPRVVLLVYYIYTACMLLMNMYIIGDNLISLSLTVAPGGIFR